MAGGLRRLGESIGRIPSAGIGLAYLAAIPLFALIYHLLLPFDFFHATVRYEPFVVAQAQSAATKLRERFVAAASSEMKDRPTINGRPVPRPQGPPGMDFPVFTVHAEPDRVRILALFLLPDSGLKDPILRLAMDFPDYGSMHPATDNPPDGAAAKWVFFTEVNTTMLSGDSAVSLPQLLPCRFGAKHRTCLPMTFDEYHTLHSLRSTALGAPTPLQASYLRMLYFSAVTISTLGYGDIVPITSRARGVVTIEIVLGPLLFGLFLNSLVKERDRPADLHRSTTPDPS